MKNRLAADARGVGHMGVFVAVVVLVLVGATGWWVMSKQKDDSGSTASTAVREALKNAKCDYDDKDLCKFMTGWEANESYTVTSTIKSEGKTTTTVFKSESDEKYYLKTSGDEAGQSAETLSIGTAYYVRAADGTWWKQTLDNDKAVEYQQDNELDFKEPEKDAPESAAPTYKKIGKEACGKLTCFKYEIIDPASADTTQFIWFDDEDYLLRKMTNKNKDGSETYESTFDYARVSIKEPSPVKELGPNQYIVPGQAEPTTMPEAPSQAEIDALIQQYQ